MTELTGKSSTGLDSSLISGSCSHVAPFGPPPPLAPPRPPRYDMLEGEVVLAACGLAMG
jgi:hypothetical protein